MNGLRAVVDGGHPARLTVLDHARIEIAADIPFSRVELVDDDGRAIWWYQHSIAIGVGESLRLTLSGEEV